MSIKELLANRRGFLRRVANVVAGTGLVAAGAEAAELEASTEHSGRPNIWSPRGLNPYIGEIALVGFNFAPQGWAMCDGQLLSIASNNALFSLLGTIYGGDGRTTFGLPDLRGRVPLHPGSGPGLTSRKWGEVSGSETVTLSAAQVPPHTHPISSLPSAIVRGTGTQVDGLAAGGDNGQAALSATTGSAGTGQAHNNMQPFVGIHFIIALQGVFPSRS